MIFKELTRLIGQTSFNKVAPDFLGIKEMNEELMHLGMVPELKKAAIRSNKSRWMRFHIFLMKKKLKSSGPCAFPLEHDHIAVRISSMETSLSRSTASSALRDEKVRPRLVLICCVEWEKKDLKYSNMAALMELGSERREPLTMRDVMLLWLLSLMHDRWKNLVFLSSSFSQQTLAFCLQKDSEILAWFHCLRSNSDFMVFFEVVRVWFLQFFPNWRVPQ